MKKIALLGESIVFSIHSLLEHRLRTLLSLLGITIGIFSIISVFTLVDSIKINIDKSISSLGDDVIYVQKWPWEFSEDFPWWTYMTRPVVRYRELDIIRKRSKIAQSSAFLIQSNTTLKYQSNVAEGVRISAVSDGYEKINSFELSGGRYFSDEELSSGKNLIVIGSAVSELLFGNNNPVGKTILVKGKKVLVIGVFKREGQNIIDLGLDNSAIIPVNFARSFMEIGTDQVNPHIVVKTSSGFSNLALKDELTGIMRTSRRLSPGERENFALNESKLISKGFDRLKDILYVTGGIIGFFSVLVGGFGIANIMFVSVKERTGIIGIQKALGAKNYFILAEYLSESVVLSLIGGMLGILLVFILSLILSFFIDFSIVLSLQNVLWGLVISTAIGLISGIAPAWSASKLDPVEAMRSI